MATSYSGVVPFLISLVCYIIIGPLLLLILLINEVVRLIVSLYLEIKHGGEVWLVPEGNDGVYATHNPDRSSVVLVLIRFRGKPDRENLESIYRERIRPDLDKDGNRAYRKLEYLLIREAGYPCWKKDGNFRVTNHYRFLDDKKLYDKDDLKKMSKALSEDDMDPSRPQWEFVIVPRYTERGEDEETSYLIIRFNHGYGDGLSFTMMFERLLCSNYTYYLDPLTFKIPSWKRYLFYMNAIVYGPYAALTIIRNKYKMYWPVHLEASKVERNYTWASDVSLDLIRRLKKVTGNANTTIQAVVQTAFISAAIQVLPKERIPDEWVIAEIAALLPYPDHQLQNRFTGFLYSIKSFTKDHDDFARLREAGRSAWEGVTGPFLPLFYFMSSITGRMPCFLHRALLLDGAFATTFFSNVPTTKTKARSFNNAEMLEIIGFPPQPNDTGITLLSTSYCNNLKVAALAKSSWLRQEELESIVGRIPGIIGEWAVTADKMMLK